MRLKTCLWLSFIVVMTACSESNDPYQDYVNGDYESAKKQLIPLAEKKDVKAMTYLGAIHQIEKNYEEAIDLYTNAAKLNYAPAQYNLGVMMHEGIGVEKNLSTAYSWLFLALEQGHTKAGEQLDNMVSEITPNQIMQAKEWGKEQIIKL